MGRKVEDEEIEKWIVGCNEVEPLLKFNEALEPPSFVGAWGGRERLEFPSFLFIFFFGR